MADIRRDIGMAKENWPPAIGGPLQQNAPNILFEMLIILSASKYTYNHSMSFLKILVVLLPDWLIFTQFNTKYAEFGDNMNKKSIYCCCNFFDNSIPRKRGLGFENVGFQSQQKKEEKKALFASGREFVRQCLSDGWE